MYDKLIYGKSPLERIVSLEISDGEVTSFHEDSNGLITSQIHSNKFWILTATRPSGSWIKMDGELHYKWGKQFSNRQDFSKNIAFLKKDGIDYFTIYDEKENCMVNKGMTYYKGMKPSEPSILAFDIESTGLYHDSNAKVLLISNTFRRNGIISKKLFAYDEYESERSFITAWTSWVREMNPAMIIGHNIYGFDIPYLDHLAYKNGLDGLQLGRDGSPLKISSRPSQKRIDGSRDQEYHKVRCYGREIIDTMFLAYNYDAYTKKYDSYGLKPIIKFEGLEKTDRVHYDSSKIRVNYKDVVEWAKIKEYCKDDADDSLTLYDLMAPASFYATQSIPKSFQSVTESATGSQINSMMVRSYLQDGHSLPKADQANGFSGAISIGNPGIYRNVHKVDVSSLYPSIMIQCEVYDEDKDPKGNFLRLVSTFTNERLKNKKLSKDTGNKYYSDLEQSQKGLINSMYGFLAAPGLIFNSMECAEFITKTGRDILNIALDWAKGKGFGIVNADTDSISYNKLNGEDIPEEERKLLLSELNGLYPEKIKFEDDGYFKTIVVLKAKNYIMDDGKKIKYKGSAIKATQKEPALKEFIKRIIDSILQGKEDYCDIYNSYVKEIANVQDIKRWASRKTISAKVLDAKRSTESRIKDAIDNTEYVEGDRCYMFFKEPKVLEIVERFDGTYDKDKLYGKLNDTAYVFETVLPVKDLFIDYKLKRSKPLLEELLNAKSV